MNQQNRFAGELCLFAACLFPCAAQTLDTGILGMVTDPSGAAIVGAIVSVTQSATGVSKTATTDTGGRYEIRYLVPGEYTAEAKSQGFRAERQSGIVIQIGQLAPINFALVVGNVVETVDVTAVSPLLRTENATLGEVVAPERIVNLPLNGRSFVQLSILTPGVRTSEPSQFTSSTGGSRIIANGARDAWMQVNIDGITMVDNRSNYVNLFPAIDALQEFKVQSGNYSAEYGGNAGANTNLQLRSGSNQYHGTVWEFLRNDKLDARGYFRPAPFAKDNLKRNQFGVVAAGPIRKDKTFFMVAYEGVRAVQESAGTNIVLTPAQRAGNFSASTAPVIDPFSGSPFPGNMIPQSRLNPVSVALINQYVPLPNTSGSINYSGVTQGHLATDQGIVRLDQYFGPKDQVFVHYIRSRRDFPNVELNPSFYFNGTQPISSLSTQYVHTFTPTLLNEVRFGFNLINVSVLSPRQNTNFTIASLGIEGLNVGGPSGRPLRADEQGFPVLNISGYLGMGDDQASSNLDNSRTYQAVDNLSWIHGRHSAKFGVDVRKLLSDATTNNWPFGNMAFTGDITGNAAADYILGFPRTTLTPEGVPISKIRQWRLAAYAQDDVRVTSNLTVNLGLRYDFVGQPRDINGVTRTLRFDLDPNGPVLWPAPGTVADIYKNEYLYFSPRFGFAYRMPHDTVIRGGYGIFYSAAQFDNTNILQLNPPGAGSLTVTNPVVNPAATINNPVPASLYPNNPIFNVVSVPQDRLRHNAYLQNWNIQLSRQLTRNDVVEAGWVGSKGTHVDTSLQNFNQPDPGPGDIQSRRPYPQYARIRLIAPDTNTVYHSLQSRYEHRFSNGLSVSAAYTWSHLIDDAAETINAGGCVCQDPRHRGKAERASSVLDQRHRMVIGYVWEVPFGKSLKSAPGAVLGGWAVGGLLTFASGLPFNITQSGDSENNDGLWERPNLVPGQGVNPASQTPNTWFNTAAFQRAILQYGASPRDPFVGPGTNTWDLSASKTFKLPWREGHQLLYRSEFFNTFNSPQFSNPGSTLGTGTFGRITGTAIANRQIQMALKYIF